MRAHQTLRRAVFAVAEGFTGHNQIVQPVFQAGGNAEVIHRIGDNEAAGGFHLLHHRHQPRQQRRLFRVRLLPLEHGGDKHFHRGLVQRLDVGFRQINGLHAACGELGQQVGNHAVGGGHG